MEQLTTPILFIIFNRPDKTKIVFEQIRKAKPRKLFISADGPRQGNSDDIRLTHEVREIVKTIDWPCEVKTRFQEKNLGCKINASSSVTWFFEHIENGIILEDDCLPVPEFFTYCENLLERYKDDERIMHINGTNFLNKDEITDKSVSYHFSRCPQLWGWATWRRAWKLYDLSMSHLDTLTKELGTDELFKSKKYLKFWIKHCKHIRDKNVDTWDAQWQYTIMYYHGYVITPHFNLIQNIGFGPDATHTKESADIYAQNSDNKIDKNLKYPKEIIVDLDADAYLINKLYMKSIWQKILSRLIKYK